MLYEVITVVLNYIQGGTGVAIGSDTGKTFAQDAVIMPFSWGATVKQDGGNITGELLTIWRNAAYMLTGLTMPTSAVKADRVSTITTTTVSYDYRNGTYFNTTVRNNFV